jgi:ribosome biogenesis GTPase
MTLAELGWRGDRFGVQGGCSPGDRLGRVAVVHRGVSVVATEEGDWSAEVSGRLRHDARLDPAAAVPAVGDWVVVRPRPGERRGTIQAILPRRTQLARKAAGRTSATQVVAANVDVALVVTALDRDLNPRRLERYIALAWAGGVQPAVVLSKADLCPNPAGALTAIAPITTGVPVHLVSSVSGSGLEELVPHFAENRTVAFLGSSGVGKSTLINRLLGHDRQRVQEVREDGKGRHTTSHRELIARPGGGLLIDTPGLRELQLGEDEDQGLAATFAEVEELAVGCRFTDCSHRNEPGCAVLAAVRDGRLEPSRLENYRKLGREARYLESRQDEQIRHERRQEERRLHRQMYRWLDQKRR